MNLKQFKSKIKKRSPKTFARVQKQWDYKMIGPVTDFVLAIEKHVNPRVIKLLRKHEYLYDGPEIEAELWKLLAKVRKMTQLEK